MSKIIICVAPKCESNSVRNPDRKFFGFPKLQDIKNEWLDVLSLKRSQLSDSTRVCELHFRSKDFCAGKKSLKYHAVPIRKSGSHGKFDPDESDSAEEFMDCGSESDPEILEVKQVSKSTVKVKTEKPETKEEETTEPEPSRRPSRRAAQLAVKKIQNTVRNLGIAAAEVSSDDHHHVHKFEPRKVQQNKRMRDYKNWHAIKASSADIDLMMECHEELLSPTQIDMLMKTQTDYNNVMKILRTLRANNARIICANSNDEIIEPLSSAPVKLTPVAATASGIRLPNIVTLNPTSINPAIPSAITVLPIQMMPVQGSGSPVTTKTISILKTSPLVTLTASPTLKR